VKPLLIIVVGALAAAAIGLAVMQWITGPRCNEARVKTLTAELLAKSPRARTPGELLEVLEDDYEIDCHEALLTGEILGCHVMTYCGFGSSMDAAIDIHVRQDADGGWALVP
jgi:hypothetical protein